MQDKSVLLNSGETHGVVLLRSSHAFLMRTLDTDSKRDVLLTLRSKQDRKGKPRVAVIVRSKHVGYLPDDIAESLLPAIKACARKGASARARGTMSVSAKTPGKVRVTVSLSDPDHLLTVPQGGAEESDEADHEDQAKHEETTAPAALVEVVPPDEVRAPDEIPGPDEAPEPEQAPTPDEEPATAEEEPAVTENESLVTDASDAVKSEVEPAPDETPQPDGTPADEKDPAAPDDFSAPACEDEPPASTAPTDTSDLSAGHAEDYPEWSPLKPVRATHDEPTTTEPTPESKPSPDAYLDTRSAWVPDMANPNTKPQPGWLGYSASSAGRSSTPMPEGPSTKSAHLGSTGFLTSGKPGHGRADRGGGDIDSEIADAWRSSTQSSRPEPQAPPTKRSRRRRSSGSWAMPMVALLILGGIAFVTWKFVFGPTTFTDPQHGYSFSHPGRWKVIDDKPIPPQFAQLINVGQMPDLVVVGTGLDSDDSGEAAMVAVASGEIRSSADGYRIASQIQRDLYLAANSGTTLSVLDPTRASAVGDLDAWKTTVSLATASGSITVTYCVLLDGNTGYALIAAATGDAWSDNRSAFDHFFDSFDPG